MSRLRISLRISAWGTRRREELFRVYLTRYSRDVGELTIRSIYASGGVVVFGTVVLKAEGDLDAGILSNYAETGDVPEILVTSLFNLSTAIAEEVKRYERGAVGSVI